MEYFGNSDIGRKRRSNQDSFLIEQLGDGVLLAAVFDGMGGHNGGETASRIACGRFAEVIKSTLAPRVDEITGTLDATKTQIFNVLTKAAEEANAAVFEAAAQDDQLLGMGTTLAAILVSGDIGYAINVGDSRIYAVSDGEITQISRDHSYVQYLIDIGEITEEEAKTNANKSIITRAVGTSETIEADTYVTEIANTSILICSDGLSNHIESNDLLKIITEAHSAKECVDTLIQTANENGGSDNITAIIVRA